MSAVFEERPSFFEGQYLSAQDLEALLDYTRSALRRHALAGHTWGIAMGLDIELIERESTIEIVVSPGLAWDGYGRTLMVMAPKPIPISALDGQGDGAYPVWLRLVETPGRTVRPGFEVCRAADEFIRIHEATQIVVGSRPFIQQQGGVEVAGVLESDPRDLLEDRDLVLCDASVPHQDFPPDDKPPEWLVPIGIVRWQAGPPGGTGQFVKPLPVDKLDARRIRVYAGVVVEGVQAADGLIRLRSRTAPTDPLLTTEQLCAGHRVQQQDLTGPDPADPASADEPVGVEDLVWVEGNLRGLGHVRMWGTSVEFRADGGRTRDVPLFLRRAAAGGLGGEDLELAIGRADDANPDDNRLVIGNQADPPEDPLAPKVVVTGGGKVGIGAPDPTAFDGAADDLVVNGAGDTGVTISAGAAKTSNLFFGDGPGDPNAKRGRIVYDHADNGMSFATDSREFVHFVTNPDRQRVGVGTDDPGAFDPTASDLVIARDDENSGLTIKSGSNAAGHIHFADGTAGDQRHRGYVDYFHDEDKLRLGAGSRNHVTVDGDGTILFHEALAAMSSHVVILPSGYFGIGTENPLVAIEVHADDPDVILDCLPGSIYSPAVRFQDDRTQKSKLTWSRASQQTELEHDGVTALSCERDRLHLRPRGGDVTIHETRPEEERVVITDQGRLGVGTSAPNVSIHVRNPNPELVLDSSGGGDPDLRMSIAGVERGRLELDRATDTMRLVSRGLAAVACAGADVGVGTVAPANRLHVRDDRPGDGSSTNDHVAFIENRNTGTSSVLALRVNRAAPNGNNNFVTFFGTGGPVGRIEGFGGSVRVTGPGADYAEWVPRADPSEALEPGDVVCFGARGASRRIGASSAVAVVTDQALVAGNDPGDDRQRHALVAFLGQVDVRTRGPVRAGMLLVASGDHDGCATAIEEEDLRPRDLSRVVGRAIDGDASEEVRRVRCLVAVDPGGTRAVAAKMAERLDAMEARLAALEKRLDG